MNENRRLLCDLNPSHTTPTNSRRRSLGRGQQPPVSQLLNFSSGSSEEGANETIVDHPDLGLDRVTPEPAEQELINHIPIIEINRNLIMAHAPISISEMLKMVPDFKGRREDLDNFLLAGDIIFASYEPPAIIPPQFITIVKARVHADCKGAITDLNTWPEIKAELQSCILPVRSVTELVQLMATTKQGANQSARDYGNQMEQILVDLLEATRATTDQAAHIHFETSYRTQALNNFIFGLKDPLRTWVKGEAPASLRAAREIATRDEPMLVQTIVRQNPNINRNNPNQNINQNINNQNNQAQSTQRVNRPVPGTDPICYKCGRTGHTADRCFARVNLQANNQPPLPTAQPIVCYSCGQQGHYSTTCPNPRQQAPPLAIKNEPANIRVVRCNYCKGNDHTIHQCQLRIRRNQGQPSCGYCGLNNHTEDVCNKKISDRKNQQGTTAQIHVITSKNDEGIPSAGSPTPSGSQSPQYGPGTSQNY